ncbi:hypothetical protein ACFT5B_08790 [Luteimicrobium sp. NPDC057192]|uniref:hypothetical protein n=1 Tax=Luteimicrobium sp. NPDC057192 TaxID=3346042 RepID=UPI003625E3D4
MSETYPPTGRAGLARGAEPGAEDQGGALSAAKDASSEVLGEAQGRAADVVGETKEQARSLLDQTRSELTDQAAQQQRSLAGNLRSVGDELSRMSSAAEDPGYATDLVSRASGAVTGAADWLDDREPGDVLGELSDFARRQPLVFLAAAGLAGVVAGRLVRGMKDAPSDGPSRPQPQSAPVARRSTQAQPTQAQPTSSSPASSNPAATLPSSGAAAPAAGGFVGSEVRDVDVP